MNNDDQQEFHEGQVEAANRPDDAGAMFTVSLPLAAWSHTEYPQIPQ